MLLYFIIFIEGFVTISLEILTIRQLIPLVGNNVIVTSLIIGVFLLFLAQGYRKGGLYTGNYQKILKNNFTYAALGLGLGLSYTFIESFFEVSSFFFSPTSLWPLFLYLLLIISPTVYLLGQTVPITLNLWKKNDSLGKTGGQVLQLSTLGSFCGASITALLFLTYFGVAASIFIDFFLMVILIFILMNFRAEITRFFILVLATMAVYTVNIVFEKNMFIATTSYGNYAIVPASLDQEKTGRILNINDSQSSYLNSKKQGFPYIELLKKILFVDLKLKDKKILVLGAGGFTVSAEQTHGNHFVYVDIDKKLPTIIKNHFLLKINGSFIADDARHYLTTLKNKNSFDVIISDVYSNRHTITPHLITREYFVSIEKALTDQGFAFFNIIARPMLDDAYSKRIDTTLRSVFTSCLAIPQAYTQAATNIIYVCKKSAYNEDKSFYSDDLNRVSLDYHGSL